jgi:hypothetical protein
VDELVNERPRDNRPCTHRSVVNPCDVRTRSSPS